MDLQLKDKVVIITGGAQGIGASCVKSFAKEGAIPVIADRAQHLGQALIDQLGCGKMIQAELDQEADCKSLVEQTLESFDRIDGIVHNAGKNDGVSLRDQPSQFLNSLKINLFHIFSITHYALDALINSKGFLIQIGSKVASTGQGHTSGYAAAKGAINGLTREWALDLAQYGIRVNSVIPAEVMTPQYENWLASLQNSEETLKSIESRIPLHARMTSSDEIADTVVFLASPKSGHTTGQLIHPDGGYIHFDRSYGDLNKESSLR